jgi:hypothetical protein
MHVGMLAPVSHPAEQLHLSMQLDVLSTLVLTAPPEGSLQVSSGWRSSSPTAVPLASGALGLKAQVWF